MKTCKNCKTEKSINFFYVNSNTCKECYKKQVKENRLKNSEYYKEYDRKRASNPNRVNARLEYKNTENGKNAHKRATKKWNENNLIKRAANQIVNNAVRDGKIQKKDYCEVCNTSDSTIHGHHDNYAYPLIVRWLCSKCHTEWHKNHGSGMNG